MSDHDRLDGWKAIADHFGRDIRTCQRWGGKHGMPVYHIDADSPRAKVFAYRSELDAWLKSRHRSGGDAPGADPATAPWPSNADPAPRSGLRRRRIEIGLLAVLLLTAAAVLAGLIRIPAFQSAGPRREPASMALIGSSLGAYDGGGGFLWDKRLDIPQDMDKYVFGYHNGGKPPGQAYGTYAVDFADVDGDGRDEAAALLPDNDPRRRAVALLDEDGRTIWKKSFNLRFIYGEAGGDNDRYVRRLSFQKLPGRDVPCLLVLWNVLKCAPSSFMILDGADGSVLLEYDHIGNLVFFEWAEIGGRPYILLGGTNNLASHDGILAAIDPSQLVSGLAPPYTIEPGLESERDELTGYLAEYREGRAPRAGQAHLIRIPITPLSRSLGIKWLFLHGAAVEGRRIYATLEAAADCPLYYHFDAGFQPLFVRAGADFERSYEAWRRSGKTSGSLAEFLEKAKRDIAYWSGQGWRAYP